MQRHFTLVPSFYLQALLVVLYGIAAATLLLLASFGAWIFFILLLLSLSLLFHLLRDARLSLADSCIAIWLEEDRVVLIARTGVHQEGALLRHSVVTPYFVILNVAIPGRYFARSIMVMPDSMDAESFRRLRVVLRWSDLPLK